MNEFDRILGEDARMLVIASLGISSLLDDEMTKTEVSDRPHEDDHPPKIVQNVQLLHNSIDLSDNK